MTGAASTRPREPAGFATLACLVVFFLGTADQVFAVRAFGVNVRIANVLLAAGLIAWLATRGKSAMRDLVPLAIAWMPFALVYAAAACASETPWLTLLKLAWFALNLVTAFAWCRLFDPRDVARGYFAAFLLVSGILAVDFMNGFSRGSAYMIGFSQPNDLVPGQILHRPHAFYYEPSYAASGVALAWGIALTPVGRMATTLSTLLVGLGLAAVAVTMSRIGWLYALLAGAARVVVPGERQRGVKAFPWPRIVASLAVATLACILLLAPQGNRERFMSLVHALGFEHTLERVCPIVREHAAFLRLQCLDEAARSRIVGRARDVVPEDTSEGQRFVSLRESLARVAERPWLGRGVTRGDHRLIEPVASNVWLEIAVEGGLLAVVAFVWGLAYSLHRWRAFAAGNRLIGTMLVLYFVVAWQFLQTFPRLDPWLSFWVALTFAATHRPAPSGTAAFEDRARAST